MVLRFVFFLLLFVFTYFPVYSWEGILWRTLRPGKNLDMMLIDDFEEKIKWNLANSLPVASILRFAEINPADRGINNPGSDKNENLYRDELDLLSESARIHGRTFSKTQKYSQELAVFFANPGIDYQFMQAPEKDRHFLQGRPVAISLWVMGKGKRHALYAIFSNRVRQKIQIKMGNLDFSGWKRFEVTLPPDIARRNRINHKVYEFRFDGLKITSNPAESAGNFLFACDLISIMIDKTPGDYPGAEIKDNWK